MMPIGDSINKYFHMGLLDRLDDTIELTRVIIAFITTEYNEFIAFYAKTFKFLSIYDF